MKGILDIVGEDNRHVFHGVHMLLDSQPDRPWDDGPRVNQLVFIGPVSYTHPEPTRPY